MESILKIYLPVYFLAYFCATLVYPSIRTYRQTGINPVTFSNKDTAHDYSGFVMKVLIGLLFASVLVYSFGGGNYRYLVAVWYLERDAIKIAGLVIIHLALIWIIIAQRQMSNSWRIGIDDKNKTELVKHGVFSISRNPVFLGMILTVAGIFLILPNAVTLCLTALTYFIIQMQIRLEEAFLEQQHGQAYLDYKTTTRRLI